MLSHWKNQRNQSTKAVLVARKLWEDEEKETESFLGQIKALKMFFVGESFGLKHCTPRDIPHGKTFSTMQESH